jgi:hypothetical protein
MRSHVNIFDSIILGFAARSARQAMTRSRRPAAQEAASAERKAPLAQSEGAEAEVIAVASLERHATIAAWP